MLTARRTFAATATVALLAAAGVTAAVAADPAPEPPPRIAFLANGHVAADALAAGPIAGQLGAPMYTTAQGSLVDAARVALESYDPELVIVLGGPVAISDAVVGQVEDATGLVYTDAPTPDGGVVRAAGGDRFGTATAVANLLAAYDPAYLPVGAQVDADTLDGVDSSQFARKDDLGAGGGDADTLDGIDSSGFLPSDGKAVTAGHADTASQADAADTAGHADTASEAATLDGKDADTWYSKSQSDNRYASDGHDHAFEYATNAAVSIGPGGLTTLVSATVSLPEECGGFPYAGSHTISIDADTTLNNWEYTDLAFLVLVDGDEVARSHLNTTMDGQRPISIGAAAASLDSDDHLVELAVENYEFDELGAGNNRLRVEQRGWTCETITR